MSLAGQRCTSTRRLIVHESIFAQVEEKLTNAYKQLRIGNPLNAENHVGPLIDQDAVSQYETALKNISLEGGEWVVEGGTLTQ